MLHNGGTVSPNKRMKLTSGRERDERPLAAYAQC